jgi:hypothetical protein
MSVKLHTKHAAMVADLRRTVPLPRLVAAMASVISARRQRAGLDPNFRLPNPEQQLDEFMQASSLRQLKLLREIATGLADGGVYREEELPEELPDNLPEETQKGFRN